METLRVGDAVFVRPLNEYAWAPWLYEQFSHRGDVGQAHPLHFQPRLPTVLNFVMGDGESSLEVGTYGDVEVGAAFEIRGVTVYSADAATVVVELQASTYADYPDGFENICAQAAPTLLGATKARDTELDGWRRFLPADTVLRFGITSAVGAFRVTVALDVV